MNVCNNNKQSSKEISDTAITYVEHYVNVVASKNHD